MPAETELVSGASAHATFHFSIAYMAAPDVDVRHVALPVLLRHACGHGARISHGTLEDVRCLELEQGVACVSCTLMQSDFSATTFAKHACSPVHVARATHDTIFCTRPALGVARVAICLGDSLYGPRDLGGCQEGCRGS